MAIKQSKMSCTLLSNYILAVTLLKNIAMKFSNPTEFYNSYDDTFSKLTQAERLLMLYGRPTPA